MKKRPSLDQVHKVIDFDLDISNPAAAETAAPVVYDRNAMVEIPIGKIEVDKNIRDTYEDDSLEELGDSIIENGQIQPIIVTPHGNKFMVKVGHRRYKACLLRDVPTVKCIIADDFADERDRIITQAIENEQRLNLSSRERESYIAQLVDLGLTQTQIAKSLHKTKGWVSEALTSHKLVSENQELFDQLTEEPSTRDTWKASTLSKAQLKSVIQETKKHGGTKEAFKKEVTKKFNENNLTTKDKAEKRLVISSVLSLNEGKKELMIHSLDCPDEGLRNFLMTQIKNYYTKKSYKVEK